MHPQGGSGVGGGKILFIHGHEHQRLSQAFAGSKNHCGSGRSFYDWEKTYFGGGILSQRIVKPEKAGEYINNERKVNTKRRK